MSGHHYYLSFLMNILQVLFPLQDIYVKHETLEFDQFQIINKDDSSMEETKYDEDQDLGAPVHDSFLTPYAAMEVSFGVSIHSMSLCYRGRNKNRVETYFFLSNFFHLASLNVRNFLNDCTI